MKRIIKIFAAIIITGFLIFIFQTEFYRLHSRAELNQKEQSVMVAEASSSLESLDVPVGALLIYHDSILSSGRNTVLRDSNASGHAEINAISNAIRKIGFKNFSKLDRNDLVLMSTFEPCLMCKGAMMEYGIKHIYFIKGKGISHWLKNDLKEFRYEWNKRQTGEEEIQDSLFNRHPAYPKQF